MRCKNESGNWDLVSSLKRGNKKREVEKGKGKKRKEKKENAIPERIERVKRPKRNDSLEHVKTPEI